MRIVGCDTLHETVIPHRRPRRIYLLHVLTKFVRQANTYRRNVIVAPLGTILAPKHVRYATKCQEFHGNLDRVSMEKTRPDDKNDDGDDEDCYKDRPRDRMVANVTR